jgi:hypothetical protein
MDGSGKLRAAVGRGRTSAGVTDPYFTMLSAAGVGQQTTGCVTTAIVLHYGKIFHIKMKLSLFICGSYDLL